MRFELERQMRPGERLRLSIDFTKDVQRVTGDTAALISVALTKEDGSAATPAVISDPLLSGSVGYATIDDPVGNVNYLVGYTLTTTLGFVYQHDILVPVRADA